MWIFITAIFLVLFFLFYRHPKEMFKAAGALVAVIGLGILGVVLWDQYTAQERAAQTAQQQALQEAESARQRELRLEQERQESSRKRKESSNGRKI